MTTSVHSNHYKYQKQLGQINLNAVGGIKVILMDSSFAFDKDTHSVLSDVADHQLATGNGYTQNDETLVVDTHTEDDTLDKAIMKYDDAAWTASGGSIGPTGAACIIDTNALEATEFITNSVDRDFTGGSSNWANVDLGGSFDDTDDLSLVATVVGQYCAIPFTNIGSLIAGGLYRLYYDHAESLAGFEFKINGVAEQTLGDAVVGTDQYIDFYADESFTGTDELRIYSKTNAAASGDFDNFSLKELGTVIGCIDYETDYTITDGTSFQINSITVNDA